MPHTPPRLLLLLSTVLALAVGFAACGGNGEEAPTAPATSGAASPSPSGPPEKVTFMAGFKPQANLPFVGAYIAQKKGFFAEQNLDVTIQHVSTPGDNFRFLASGEIQFSTADAASILERRSADPPLPIVSIALIGQRGQQGFAVLANSGIQSPKDWVGKTAGYKGSKPTPDYLAILAQEGIDRSSIQEVRVGFEPQILTEGQVDIFPVFLSNEPDTLRRLGYQTNLFEAADYGAPTLGLTYVATEKFIREKPDVVLRFLKAVLKGIQYAANNRQEAVDIVLQFAPQEDRAHQQYMLETELQAALLGQAYQNGIGWQTAEQWKALHDFLVQYQGISRPLPDPNAAFSDQFLKQAYKNGELVWP